MKKGLLFCLLVLTLGIAGCLLEEAKEEAGTGTLKVTVNTSTAIWTYPLEDPSALTTYYEFATSVASRTKKFRYDVVGGDNDITDGSVPVSYYPDVTWEDKAASNSITTAKVGTKTNYVYLFSAIEQKSDNNPVLRNGESDANNGVITISGITPGTYYVLAFYDYASGGNTENIFNRYDRYALYAETGGLSGTSTPFFDNATTITIAEDQTVEITLDINENWVLGKPKADNRTDPADANTATVSYEMGRYFLKDGETIPSY